MIAPSILFVRQNHDSCAAGVPLDARGAKNCGDLPREL